jgi:hypothetical protein
MYRGIEEAKIKIRTLLHLQETQSIVSDNLNRLWLTGLQSDISGS